METTVTRTTPEPKIQSQPESKRSPNLALQSALLASAAAVAACGGGDGDGEPGEIAATNDSSERARATAVSKAPVMSAVEASRLLAQASFGADRAEIDRVRTLGVDAWLDEQFKMGSSQGHVAWLRSQGLDRPSEHFSRDNLDYTVWRKFLSSPDGLRQRMVFALSQIMVISVENIGGYWSAFSAGYYMDLLEKNAFGNFRDLLQDVTLSPAMGRYLSMRRSRKADSTGRQPDENYAREVMQLFTIGLVELNDDGTPKLVNEKPQPSYDETDVAGLARVFTGYEYANKDKDDDNKPDVHVRPLVNNASYHELGPKTFLDNTIQANTSAGDSLQQALNILFKHSNVGPFIGKQLIQRFVTSNPSPAYVKRVAGVFANNGKGTRGNLAAVLRAILTDTEARNSTTARNDPAFGKLREPVLRFAQWARACKVESKSGKWKVPNLSNPVDRLGQNPMRSPSVFNFYRPGYAPPNTDLARLSKVAPEFQITTESSVAGYVNFMQSVISTRNGIINSDVKPNYTAWLAKANNARDLVNEANEVLACGQLSAATVNTITQAIESIPSNTTDQRTQRVQTAVLLTLVAPEYLCLK